MLSFLNKSAPCAQQPSSSSRRSCTCQLCLSAICPCTGKMYVCGRPHSSPPSLHHPVGRICYLSLSIVAHFCGLVCVALAEHPRLSTFHINQSFLLNSPMFPWPLLYLSWTPPPLTIASNTILLSSGSTCGLSHSMLEIKQRGSQCSKDLAFLIPPLHFDHPWMFDSSGTPDVTDVINKE